jgi:hypothetical protein
MTPMGDTPKTRVSPMVNMLFFLNFPAMGDTPKTRVSSMGVIASDYVNYLRDKIFISGQKYYFRDKVFMKSANSIISEQMLLF